MLLATIAAATATPALHPICPSDSSSFKTLLKAYGHQNAATQLATRAK